MYEIFEHTADLGIRVRGESADQLFADAAKALFSVMVSNLRDVRPTEEIVLDVVGDDFEELLHDWLAELLFTFHVRRLVLCEFQVRVVPGGLTAVAKGEAIDPARHEIDVEVKAVTWHGLKLEHESSGWVAEVIVDI